jgi:MoaA/NifB/PqqE/SkfB family radical SAM enzyme
MYIPSFAVRRARPFLERHARAKSLAKSVDLRLARARHSIAAYFPSLIKPQPRQLTVAITAHCNLRCRGCRYGRDFMPGQRLSLPIMLHVLDDAKAAGIGTVRFYGGEPLLHPELPAMIRHATTLGLRSYVTSNGTHLKHKIDALYQAGLRLVTIGYYGTGNAYDSYTQRQDHFRRLEEGLAAVRARYHNKLELQLNFVLMRPSCNLEALTEAWTFAKRFDMYFHIDLVSYSVPFFIQGIDHDFQFTEADRPAIESVVERLIELKQREPSRFIHSPEFLRSIPDWLGKKADMRVPCDAYEMIWIGADGTVQLCDTTFQLGNVKERRLREILFGEAHRCAARDGFLLNCPNCICRVDPRIQKHAASVRRYRPSAGIG